MQLTNFLAAIKNATSDVELQTAISEISAKIMSPEVFLELSQLLSANIEECKLLFLNEDVHQCFIECIEANDPDIMALVNINRHNVLGQYLASVIQENNIDRVANIKLQSTIAAKNALEDEMFQALKGFEDILGSSVVIPQKYSGTSSTHFEPQKKEIPDRKEPLKGNDNSFKK